MEITKYFSIDDYSRRENAFIFEIIAGRCYGSKADPDTGEGWEKYNNVTISLIRTNKRQIPDNEESYNIVSNCCFNFSVKELADDFSSETPNKKIEKILNTISRLPVGKCPSCFYLKVDIN